MIRFAYRNNSAVGGWMVDPGVGADRQEAAGGFQVRGDTSLVKRILGCGEEGEVDGHQRCRGRKMTYGCAGSWEQG